MWLHVALVAQSPVNVVPCPFAIQVEVSIYNPAEHPVTFLNWSTPFDHLAGPLGVFTVHDKVVGETVPMDIVKISRKLPATREDLIEIPADQTVKKMMHIHGVRLKADHGYLVHAEGVWLAIWEKALADINEGQLEDLGDSKRGEFKSNPTLLKAT